MSTLCASERGKFSQLRRWFLNVPPGVFVVSTSNASVMDQFERLTQQQHQRQHQQPHKLPKWFCPNILTYYVLLSDVVDDAATHAR